MPTLSPVPSQQAPANDEARQLRTALFPLPAVVIMASAFAVVVPFFFYGNASGHDFEFHLLSWMEVVHQWREGNLWPRWAEFAHWGYGEARFLFYPPASWNLGAILGVLLPWKTASGAYVWVALTTSGCSMFLLARRWLSRGDAIFAAALYAANPYYLVIVYWRSALAELLAGCLLPLLLLFILRAEEDGRRVIVPLTLVVTAAWLTNAPSAVMVNYSLALLIVTAAIVQRKPVFLLYGGAAVLLGLGLASFYVIPAAYEEKWVNIAQVLAPGLRPQDNFFFTFSNDVDHNRFNMVVSLVGIAEILTLAAAIFLTRKWREQRKTIWLLLAVWGGAASLLMLPVTLIFWRYLPELRFVQLPWRWLLCLNVAFALFVTMGCRRWITRILLCAALLSVVIIAWRRVQPPWWDTAADVQEMHDFIEDGDGYEGTDEYVPAGVDPYELKKDASQIATVSGDPATIRIEHWNAQSRVFSADVFRPETLRLRLLNYPAWSVELNGHEITAGTQSVTGEILIPVDPGSNRVRVTFAQTQDRLLGNVVSGATLLLVIVWSVYRRAQEQGSSVKSPMRKILVATSNPGKLRDFAGAAAAHEVEIAAIPNFAALPVVIEDGLTFEENARKKAEQYSLAVPGEIVIADDSGLEVDALNGAPGVHSARYAADEPHKADENTDDAANNARVLRELSGIALEKRTGRFVCLIAAARNGQTLATFRGVAEGVILDHLRGSGGFGYDPMFYFPEIQKTFAEIPPEEKAKYSHRGAAFRKFLAWIGDFYAPS